MPTVYPLPDRTIDEARSLTVYAISGFTDNFLNMNLGSEKVFGVIDAGFFDREETGTVGRRWTDGSATLLVPIDSSHMPNALRVDLESTGPKGTELLIAANGTTLFQKAVPPGAWSDVLPIKNVLLKDSIVVSINSGTFVPAQERLGTDVRTLGVAVRDIRLLEGFHPFNAQPLTEAGQISSIEVRNHGSYNETIIDPHASMDISIRNVSQQTWPSRGDLVKEKGSVRIGIRWVLQGATSAPPAEQRTELPHAMFPGDQVAVTATLHPVDASGKPLPPGQYEVWIGLLQEGFAWFYEQGDTVVRLNMYIQ